MKLADLFKPKKNSFLGAVVDLGAAVKEQFSSNSADTSLHSEDHEEGGSASGTEYEEVHATSEKYVAQVETQETSMTVTAEKMEVLARSYRSLNIPIPEAERLANRIRLETLHTAEEWCNESRDRGKFRPVADALFGPSTRKKVERNAQLRNFTGYDQDGRPLKKPATPLHFAEFKAWAANAGLQYTVVRQTEIWETEYQFFFGMSERNSQEDSEDSGDDPAVLQPANQGASNRNLSPKKEAGGVASGKGGGKGDKNKPGKGDKKAKKAADKKKGTGLSPGDRPTKPSASKMITLSASPTLGEVSQKLGVAKYDLLFGKGKISDTLDLAKVISDVRQRELRRTRKGRRYLETHKKFAEVLQSDKEALLQLEESLKKVNGKIQYAEKKGVDKSELEHQLLKLQEEVTSKKSLVKWTEDRLAFCPKWLQNFERRSISKVNFAISKDLVVKVAKVYGFEVYLGNSHEGVGTYARGYFYDESYPRVETRTRETKVQIYKKSRVYRAAPIPEETKQYGKRLRQEAEKSGEWSDADRMDDYISLLRSPYRDYTWQGSKFKPGVISINWMVAGSFSSVEVEERKPKGIETVVRPLSGSPYLDEKNEQYYPRTVRILDAR